MQFSVILKRQVPIRHNDRPRSWLGGLPMMPKLVRWPRDADGAPLHFLAQIACEDLPVELWNGHGPRKGWLLLFAETLKLEDEADGRMVQVLHVNRLGSEREPPKDTPTVRHAMSDYIHWTGPKIRSGVPKLWRKWPVDLVPQYYDPMDTEEDPYCPPPISAEELYGAPVSERGIWDDFRDLGIDRPLTWRGALYFIEGLFRDLSPEKYERNWTRNRGGMLTPPDPEEIRFDEEKRHLAAVQSAFGVPEGGPRVIAAQDALREQILSEREDGWLKKALTVLAARRVDFEESLETARCNLDKARCSNQKKEVLSGLRSKVRYYIILIREVEQHRAHLNALAEAYPGSTGQHVLSVEIEQLGKTHLAWAAEQKAATEYWLNHIRAQDLDAALPEDTWNKIASTFENASSPYWRRTYNAKILEKTEIGLPTKRHLKMAIREDLLDLYSSGEILSSLLNEKQQELLEQKLRFFEQRLPHRIGGLANYIHGDTPDAGKVLLFQLASDKPMGWMWGDVGALYVTISEKDLQKRRFNGLNAKIEGH